MLCVEMVTNNIKFSQKCAGRKIIFFQNKKNNQVINPNYSNAFLSLRSEKDLELFKKALGHVMKDGTEIWILQKGTIKKYGWN